MLLISIVDDEPNDSAALKNLVEKYFRQSPQPHIINVYNDALEFVRSTDNHDIVFMDIRMDKLDGLEVASLLRKINKEAILIFVTQLAQMAIKGYRVDAMDFIVKPADQFSINYVMDKAIHRLDCSASTMLPLKLSNGIVNISTGDITYVEVYDHNLIYHTAKGDYEVRGRLSDVIKQLDEKHFVMCNRSFIVNLRHVSSVTSEYLVVNGVQVSISKARRKEILQNFSNYLGDTV